MTKSDLRPFGQIAAYGAVATLTAYVCSQVGLDNDGAVYQEVMPLPARLLPMLFYFALIFWSGSRLRIGDSQGGRSIVILGCFWLLLALPFYGLTFLFPFATATMNGIFRLALLIVITAPALVTHHYLDTIILGRNSSLLVSAGKIFTAYVVTASSVAALMTVISFIAWIFGLRF